MHIASRPRLRSKLGFNGEYSERHAVQLLGSYRAYNPVLMRFHKPDSLSPFGNGGLNTYTYCLGDPVNHSDPTGHLTYDQWTQSIPAKLAIFPLVAAIATAATWFIMPKGKAKDAIGIASAALLGTALVLAGTPLLKHVMPNTYPKIANRLLGRPRLSTPRNEASPRESMSHVFEMSTHHPALAGTNVGQASTTGSMPDLPDMPPSYKEVKYTVLPPSYEESIANLPPPYSPVTATKTANKMIRDTSL